MIHWSGRATWRLSAFALGGSATIALLLFLHALSTQVLPPPGTESMYLAAYILLPAVIPAAVATLAIWSLPRWRDTGFALLAGTIVAYTLVLAAFMLSAIAPLGTLPLVYGPPGPKASLMIASSFLPQTEPELVDLQRRTADELNRLRQGSDLRAITYVPEDTPSTGPLVVSVNPIDAYTWGAAALSPRGRCYLILEVRNRTNPRYGETRYGWLASGVPCVGAAATPSTVTVPSGRMTSINCCWA